MPWRQRVTNFHGDHFNFSIDLIDDDGLTVEFLGGMNNAYAARRTFEMLPSARLMLHQGARVLCKEEAVGGFTEWVLARAETRENRLSGNNRDDSWRPELSFSKPY